MSRLGAIVVLFCSSCVLGSPVSQTVPAATGLDARIPICDFVECPEVNCESPIRADGQCCVVCPRKRRDAPNQCIFNGIHVEHGQSFHPSLLQPSRSRDSSNPYCTRCTCLDGLIECENHTLECPELDCQETSVLPEGACCPRCPTPALTTLAPPTRTPDCRDFDGRTFFNGDSWHPSYPSYGLVPCINCTCVDSRSTCIKLPCPAGPLPPCGPDEPVQSVVLCCHKCRRVPPTASTTVEPPSVSATTSKSVTATIPPVILDSCPKVYSIKVWRNESRDAVALEYTATSPVAITLWHWSNVMGENVYTSTNDTRVSISEVTATYSFAGWTKPARVQRLTRDLNKSRKIEKCTTNCSSLVMRLLRVLSDC